MQHYFCLVQLFLYFHNAVRLLRILIFDDVFLQRRKIKCGSGICEGGAWVLYEKLVHNFRQQLVGDKSRVIRIANNDACNAFSASVGVKCVCYESIVSVAVAFKDKIQVLAKTQYIFLQYLAVGLVSFALPQSC